jgi:hypothetical protein
MCYILKINWTWEIHTLQVSLCPLCEIMWWIWFLKCWSMVRKTSAHNEHILSYVAHTIFTRIGSKHFWERFCKKYTCGCKQGTWHSQSFHLKNVSLTYHMRSNKLILKCIKVNLNYWGIFKHCSVHVCAGTQKCKRLSVTILQFCKA